MEVAVVDAIYWHETNFVRRATWGIDLRREIRVEIVFWWRGWQWQAEGWVIWGSDPTIMDKKIKPTYKMKYTVIEFLVTSHREDSTQDV